MDLGMEFSRRVCEEDAEEMLPSVTQADPPPCRGA